MVDYVKKETEVIEKIADTIGRLDNDLIKLDAISEDKKKHAIKKMLLEKHALHEIKTILSEVKKYEKYETAEVEDEAKLMELLDL